MRFEDGLIAVDRELSDLDKRVLEFVQVIESRDVEYVIVSGYVAILLGRSRGSEDVDILVDVDREGFGELWKALKDSGYWCINAGREEAWNMLEDSLSVRFAERDTVIPNFEVFIPGDEFDRAALEQRIKVELGEDELWVSPLELQVCYKLHLGSEKDFEDALHIYTVARENLKTAKLDDFARGLEVQDELGELEAEAEKA